MIFISVGERTQEGNEEKKSIQSQTSQGTWLMEGRFRDILPAQPSIVVNGRFYARDVNVVSDVKAVSRRL